MLELTKDSLIDFDKYLSDLSTLGEIYIRRDQLEQDVIALSQKVYTLNYLCKEILATKTGYTYLELTRDNIINYLINYEHCPESMFVNKKSKTGNLSLDSKKVLSPLLERGFAKEFITMYMQLTSSVSIKGLLTGLLQSSTLTDKVDYEGKPLHRLKFNINEADNMRVYYSNQNIQSIPKMSTSCMKAPEGYVLVSGDFAQSDLRIAYSMMLRTENNLPIILNYPDMYEGFARIYMGNEFDLDDFKAHRNSDYKANTLAPLYGAKSAATSKGTQYVKLANKYLTTCPRYSEFRRRLERRISIGAPINIISYFGNAQLVNKVSYGYSSKSAQDSALLDKALNTPVQTGTSEIVIASENSIMKEFAKVGVTPENGGIYAYLNRHDELVFLLKTEYLKYAYIFQNHETVKVDDWVPLKIEFSYCKSYGIPDEELTSLAHQYYDPNLDDSYEVTYDKDSFYIPVPDVMELSIGISELPNSSIKFISYYDYINNQSSFEKIDTNNYDEIYEAIVAKIARNKATMTDRDANCVHVCTQLVTSDTSVFSNVLINFTRNYSNELFQKAHLLSDYIMYDYCKNNNIAYTPSSFLLNNKSFLQFVINNGEVFED